MNKIASLALFIHLLAAQALPADEEAVRKTITNYTKAFNEQDTKTVSGYWTENATHTDRETGERTEGRDAIMKDIKAVFEEQAKLQLSGQVNRVRFIKPDVAQIEGETAVSGLGEEPVVSSFSAILIKDGDKWLIDSIEELPVPQPATAQDALMQLDWLVGRWVDETDGSRVETNIRWSSSRTFLLRSYTVQADEEVVREGTQVIGWDPRSNQIRSWSFNSDGSFGDGVWSKNGNDWLIKSSQTLANGDAASGTFVLSPSNENEMSLQLIGHEVEGEPQPAGKSVKVLRVVEEQQAASTEKQSETPSENKK